MKKIYTAIGAFTTVALPTVAVISCAEDSNNLKAKTIQKDNKKEIVYHYKPFDYNDMNEIGKGQPIFSRGIMNGSLNQGMSFLLNVAIGLGFNPKQDITKTVGDIVYEKGTIIGKKEAEKFKKEGDYLYKNIKEGMSRKIKVSEPNSSALFIDVLGIEGYYVEDETIHSSGLTKNSIFDSGNKTGKPGLFNTTGDNKFKFKVANYVQYIDGFKPGTINTTMYFKSTVQNAYKFALGTESQNNYYQTFEKIKDNKELDNFKDLIYNMLLNINNNLENHTSNASSLFTLAASLGFLAPITNKLLNYIRDMKNMEERKQEIYDIIGKLNNGSHNIFAIEIFARGMKNIPPRYMAYHGVIAKTEFQGNNLISEAIGIANVNDISSIIEWFYPTWKQGSFKKPNGGYKDEDFTDKIGNKGGEGSRWDKENYDPNIAKGLSRLIPGKDIKPEDVMKKILGIRRKGKILPLPKRIEGILKE